MAVETCRLEITSPGRPVWSDKGRVTAQRSTDMAWLPGLKT